MAPTKCPFTPLDILLEARYRHLECLLKKSASAFEFNSDEVLQVELGSLYPALHRLIKRRWIAVEEGTSENNRRAKFYRLTPKGRQQLEVEMHKWEKLTGAIARILRPAE